jgi:hypothetical protein
VVAVGDGAAVGVLVGGGGGGVMGVGIRLGGGGGVLDAANVCEVGECKITPRATNPTVTGIASPRVNRLFMCKNSFFSLLSLEQVHDMDSATSNLSLEREGLRNVTRMADLPQPALPDPAPL